MVALMVALIVALSVASESRRSAVAQRGQPCPPHVREDWAEAGTCRGNPVCAAPRSLGKWREGADGGAPRPLRRASRAATHYATSRHAAPTQWLATSSWSRHLLQLLRLSLKRRGAPCTR